MTKGVFFGLSTVDIIFGIHEFMAEDTKITADKYTVAAGGPATNAAVAFEHLGGQATLISSLGAGSLSQLAKRDLTTCGVTHLDITPQKTSDLPLSSIVINRENASRTIITSPAIIQENLDSRDFLSDILSSIEVPDVLLVDGHQASLLPVIAEWATQHNVPIVLDGDLYTQGIEGILNHVDVAIYGKTFLPASADVNSDLFDYFSRRGVQHIAATNGANPIKFLSSGVSGTMEVEECEATDTLGAGDFLHGAFCYHYCQAGDFVRGLEQAKQVATRSTQSFGTREWMGAV